MRTFRLLKDRLSKYIFLILSLFAILTVVLIAIGLYYKSYPLIHDSSLKHLLFSSEWKPSKGEFGFWGYIVGSFAVTALAILIALPLALLASIYLSEFAPYRLRQILTPLIDLLSGIPPVIYGVWGTLLIVPFIQYKIMPHFEGYEYSTGYCLLTGAIVLAVMIFPLIINILLEVFDTVPQDLRNASLSLGANEWETVKSVVLKKSFPGIIAATVLAVSRALGETIAVLMVCGSVPNIPHSPFDMVEPLPVLIANEFGEMMSIPKYDAALMFAALVLFVIIVLFNTVSRIVLYRLEKRNYV
jgi:phosphate transport system permease protein